MELQVLHANLVLDPPGQVPYHPGMKECGWRALKRLREKTGLSQEKFAELLGTQQSQISRWEKPLEKRGRKIPVHWAVAFGKHFEVKPVTFRPEMDDPQNSFDELLVDADPALREMLYRKVVEELVKAAMKPTA